MQLDGRLVIVPLWLLEATKQKGLPLSNLVNLNKLAEHFSGDDITSYHGVNKLFCSLNQAYESANESQQFKCYGELFNNIDLLEHSKALVDQDSYVVHRENELLSGIEEGGLVFLENAEGVNTLVDTLTSVAFGPRPSRNTNVYVINLFHIENGTFGLTLKPYDGVNTDSELAALETNVELLLTHYKYEEVCQTQIFHRWCLKIKKNQQ